MKPKTPRDSSLESLGLSFLPPVRRRPNGSGSDDAGLVPGGESHMFTDTVPSVSPQVLSHSHTNEQTFDEVFDKVTSQADSGASRSGAAGLAPARDHRRLHRGSGCRKPQPDRMVATAARHSSRHPLGPVVRQRYRCPGRPRRGDQPPSPAPWWRLADPVPPLGRRRTRRGRRRPSAFVGPGYAPIDDLRVFETLQRVLPAQLDEFRFVRLDLTPQSSQYAVVSLSEVDLGSRVETVTGTGSSSPTPRSALDRCPF